ncbi:hypothetical protein [Paenibacillus hexagrammi]|uniref:Uncharacterized protein n=1 Tax=Paenibacillus hexagrammi TaxID=2908839 RepID=A0ABY3SJ97_9BACL|nr:hypothetical protein [Paenibacillus sp. YPD9-1]UJF33211.1 hypothetical protein L0M14_27370 [Paenibacillus sp. YPD9-1]
MVYVYVTEDNLKYPQKYMYSAYEGIHFLQVYIQNREAAIEKIGQLTNSKFHVNEQLEYIKNRYASSAGLTVSPDAPLLANLSVSLLVILDQDCEAEGNVGWLDGLIKSFEVRKRLYAGYDEKFKPVSDQYHDLELYAQFSCLLALHYKCNQNLRYLNVLLKVNDTLISQLPRIGDPDLLNMVRLALTMEKSFIEDLCLKKGVRLDAE